MARALKVVANMAEGSFSGERRRLGLLTQGGQRLTRFLSLSAAILNYTVELLVRPGLWWKGLLFVLANAAALYPLSYAIWWYVDQQAGGSWLGLLAWRHFLVIGVGSLVMQALLITLIAALAGGGPLIDRVAIVFRVFRPMAVLFLLGALVYLWIQALSAGAAWILIGIGAAAGLVALSKLLDLALLTMRRRRGPADL